jgi:hypothetical protein
MAHAKTNPYMETPSMALTKAIHVCTLRKKSGEEVLMVTS